MIGFKSIFYVGKSDEKDFSIYLDWKVTENNEDWFIDYNLTQKLMNAGF